MCLATYTPDLICPGPRRYGSKHQRRAPVDSSTREICARRRSLQTVQPRFLTTCLNTRNLTVLNLAKNQLACIPPVVSLILSLEKLYLNGNGLSTLPKDIGQLIHLQVLDCSGNHIECVPSSIGQLKSLRVLKLGSPGAGNKIRVLPDTMGSLTSLEELCLDNNEITALPQALVELKHLHTITAHNNRIEQLPEHLSKMASLQRLDVSQNMLKELPSDITQMRAEVLNLCNNLLECVPLELCRTPMHVLLAGNPLLDVTAHPVADAPGVSEPPTLLELAMRACVGSAPLPVLSALDALPLELQDLLRTSAQCSVCARPCFNTLAEAQVVSLQAMGHVRLAVLVTIACSRCKVKAVSPST